MDLSASDMGQKEITTWDMTISYIRPVTKEILSDRDIQLFFCIIDNLFTVQVTLVFI